MTMNSLPKVELHLHLDCCLSFKAASGLDPSLTREEFKAEFVAPPQCTSLADFLTRAPRGFQLMQTGEALRLATEDLFEQLAADNIIYAEIRFAPLLHLQKGLSPEDAVSAVNRATEDCIRATGIEARLILCSLRHFRTEQSILTARLVERFKRSCVVALDLAGDEAGFALDAHIPAFRFAIEHGIKRTAHAGEAAGADSVWQTIRAFEPDRIGHGVRSDEDATLLEYLKAKRIHLEVCPSSNVQTRAVDEYRHHPVDRLLRAGLSLGINTDARTITNITLNEEYARLRQHFGWSDQEFTACNRAALDAAFLDTPTKNNLTAKLSAGLRGEEPNERSSGNSYEQH
jgi:adenosine deaminase